MQSKHRLYLVDFGLARVYRGADGKLKPPRQRAGFRGTLRYVSLRVHDRVEQGPADDLVALFFALLEMLYGELPWRRCTHQSEIRAAKEQLRRDDFLTVSQCFGEELREFGRYVTCLQQQTNVYIIDYAFVELYI